jgi:hypothetical protein
MIKFTEGSSDIEPQVGADELSSLVHEIEVIAHEAVVAGTQATDLRHQLVDFKDSGLSEYGQSLLTKDTLLNQRLLGVASDTLDMGQSYPVDHLIPFTRKFISRNSGRVINGKDEGGGSVRYKQNGRIRKFAQQLQEVAQMVSVPQEDTVVPAMPDLASHPSEITQGVSYPRDIEMYFGRKLFDLIAYLEHPSVQAAIQHLRQELPPSDDTITINFIEMDEPWEQAFTALGTICNPESLRAHRVTCLLLEAVNKWARDPAGSVLSKVTAEGQDMYATDELTQIKSLGFQFLNSLHQDSAVNSTNHEKEIEASAEAHGQLYKRNFLSTLSKKKLAIEALLAATPDSEEELLELLELETSIDEAIRSALEVKPPRVSLGSGAEEGGESLSSARKILHEYVGKLAADEYDTKRKGSMDAIRSELEDLRSNYSLTRSNFRKHADPDLEYTRSLINGFTNTLMGRQLIEPVSKEFARDFLSLMYRVANDLEQRDFRQVFDGLLLDLENEQSLTAQLDDGVLSTVHGTSLRERLSWYSANEIQLSGTMLRALPDYVSKVLGAFDEYWAIFDDERSRTSEECMDRSVTSEQAQEILGSLIELDFRLFPPETSFEMLKEELIDHIGRGTKRSEGVQWQKLENLLLLRDYYSEIGGIQVELYRALPGSLKQSFPYYVLEINDDSDPQGGQKIVIGENPIRNNATYILKEGDQSWRGVFGLTKPEARDKGATRIWHSRDPKLRAQHFEKIIDHVAQLDPKLLAFELSSSSD